VETGIKRNPNIMVKIKASTSANINILKKCFKISFTGYSGGFFFSIIKTDSTALNDAINFLLII